MHVYVLYTYYEKVNVLFGNLLQYRSAVHVLLSLYTAKLSSVLRQIQTEEKCCSTLFIIIYYEVILLFTINTQLSHRQGEYLVYVQYFFLLWFRLTCGWAAERREGDGECQELIDSLIAATTMQDGRW